LGHQKEKHDNKEKLEHTSARCFFESLTSFGGKLFGRKLAELKANTLTSGFEEELEEEEEEEEVVEVEEVVVDDELAEADEGEDEKASLTIWKIDFFF
jgi:hypothetical protein